LAALSGCATARSPDRSAPLFMTTAGEARLDEVPIKGFPARVHLSSGTQNGELVAVEPNRLWLLDGDNLSAIERAEIEKVSIEIHASGAVLYGLATGAGLASAVATQGYMLLFGGPLWLGLGLGTTLAESSANDVTIKPADWEHLREYARFPQGLPPLGVVEPAGSAGEGQVEQTLPETEQPSAPE
jgi:hypothetical protein